MCASTERNDVSCKGRYLVISDERVKGFSDETAALAEAVDWACQLDWPVLLLDKHGYVITVVHPEAVPDTRTAFAK